MTDSPPDPTTGELARRVIRRLDELLADPSARVCVGLSGGPDSVALLHMLATARPRGTVEAAHLHHGIRGEEADGDEAFEGNGHVSPDCSCLEHFVDGVEEEL